MELCVPAGTVQEKNTRAKRGPAPAAETGPAVRRESGAGNGGICYRDTEIPAPGSLSPGDPEEIPEKIAEMKRLYRYGDFSMSLKAENFCIQGKFMEDYEDEAPWNGYFQRYCPTYHDLSVPALRGYFTWRKYARRGEFRPIAVSLAYIYLYELLNGIGTDSTEDALCKMSAFEEGFLDAGYGDPEMKRALCRWMFEFAVIHGLDPQIAELYADPAERELDAALSVLKDSKDRTYAEIFSSLNDVYGNKLALSPVVAMDEERGQRLFARVWRVASEAYDPENGSLFTDCFGKRRESAFIPFWSAVYRREWSHPDTFYELNRCRSYICRDGAWKASGYSRLFFDMDKITGLFHEADRQFRKYFKTGRYLKRKESEEWAAPFAKKALEEEKKAREEEARSVIRICFDGLEKIRADAAVTRESLLTEEERGETEETCIAEEIPDGAAAAESGNNFSAERSGHFENRRPDPPVESGNGDTWRILHMLLAGEPADAYLRERHLLPSVIADEINEALFDEIGDSVVACDGSRIVFIEDYREDVEKMAGGNGYE